MEDSFGADLSHVRAFSGQAVPLARLGAVAATVGDVVAFADDHPAVETVAHEVAHVLQFRHTASPPTIGMSRASDDAEVEADLAAAATVRGERARVASPARAALMRSEIDDGPSFHVKDVVLLQRDLDTTRFQDSTVLVHFEAGRRVTVLFVEGDAVRITDGESYGWTTAAALDAAGKGGGEMPPTGPIRAISAPDVPNGWTGKWVTFYAVPDTVHPSTASGPVTGTESGYRLEATFTELAVGSASFGVYRKGDRVVVLDAGVAVIDGPTGRPDAALMERALTTLEAMVPSRVIDNLDISHMHYDHFNAALTWDKGATVRPLGFAERFTLRNVTINLFALLDPKTPRLLADLRDGAEAQGMQPPKVRILNDIDGVTHAITVTMAEIPLDGVRTWADKLDWSTSSPLGATDDMTHRLPLGFADRAPTASQSKKEGSSTATYISGPKTQVVSLPDETSQSILGSSKGAPKYDTRAEPGIDFIYRGTHHVRLSFRSDTKKFARWLVETGDPSSTEAVVISSTDGHIDQNLAYLLKDAGFDLRVARNGQDVEVGFYEDGTTVSGPSLDIDVDHTTLRARLALRAEPSAELMARFTDYVDAVSNGRSPRGPEGEALRKLLPGDLPVRTPFPATPDWPLSGLGGMDPLSTRYPLPGFDYVPPKAQAIGAAADALQMITTELIGELNESEFRSATAALDAGLPALEEHLTEHPDEGALLGYRMTHTAVDLLGVEPTMWRFEWTFGPYYGASVEEATKQMRCAPPVGDLNGYDYVRDIFVWIPSAQVGGEPQMFPIGVDPGRDTSHASVPWSGEFEFSRALQTRTFVAWEDAIVVDVDATDLTATSEPPGSLDVEVWRQVDLGFDVRIDHARLTLNGGAKGSLTLDGLSPGVVYYLMLKVPDEQAPSPIDGTVEVHYKGR